MFQGIEQVRKNWSANFSEMPDFHSTILRYVSDANTVWVEWLWQGTRQDTSKLQMCGVCIFYVEKQQIKWGRLYVEPVQAQGAGIDAAMKVVMHGKSDN